MSKKQKTIKNPVSLTGRGLHSGLDVTMTFKQAPENHGILFKRMDVDSEPVIEASPELVVDTSRGTTIAKNGRNVNTIEHCMAALAGLEIDNVLIEIDGYEAPIFDGSSKPFVDKLMEAGLVDQNEEKNYFELKENIVLKDEDNNIEMIAIPSDHFEVSAMIDYNSSVLRPQYAHMKDIAEFKEEFSSAKTFVFLHELETLIKNGLIRGGDLDNAIVFVDKLISQEELDRLSTFFKKPRVEVKERGILNNIDLKYENEPARHKLLDVLGDLYLVGRPIKAKIITTKPGHHYNVKFAGQIKKHIKDTEEKQKIPTYDPNKEPIFDIIEIRRMLPHRSPFLLVDKITEMSDNHVVGVKNATMDEPFFAGHFPKEPIFPAVLQIEAMAQAGGILVLSSVPDPENYVTYFIKIDNARFRNKVVPGDTLIFKLELMAPIRRGICQMQGTAYVGEQLVMEAQLVAQIVKK
ncbi:MAG: bifunctional UDP-3-O-[3-hydroxymyristoyl] N-acetylglucosamine deacetylase/3-hydroxyacyl-ACP dehydratase [Bacteroidales bacterium]|nr:bifunctional UDP-3-O-[3-hydroxymyristoyl] N-acetylglucosamine deacetylase/3-hydroxyacyl-ACP dehydratase [Bacteroidales bacterium]MCF8336609.1 bifunctional UDP-3-O-[3-hydroxymyristoyl] N-acetylglucosamine deacetylase/3-hydroxyacyl-ACP dehydratase [Bacteroidales bacterium]